ncbi:MAG TPA: GNAT family protein [Solirubrobacteraceae bacterium]
MRFALPDRVSGEKVALRAFAPGDVAELTDLRVRNRAFLGPWEPRRSSGFFTAGGQRAEIERDRQEWAADRTYAFAIVERPGGAMRGRIALANVVRGAWENATLGYFVDEAVGGRGYATEAVALALRFAFGSCRLHRVQAAVMPRNARSRRVLEKNGFRHEGFSPRYLRLDGAWRDHDLFAITVEEYESR